MARGAEHPARAAPVARPSMVLVDHRLPQGSRHRERLRAAARPRRPATRARRRALVRALCDRRAGIGADGVIRVVRTAATDDPRPWRHGARPSGSWTTATATARCRRCAATASACSAATSPTRGRVDPRRPLPIATRAGRQGAHLRGRPRSPSTWAAREVLGETKVAVGDRPGRPPRSTWATRTRSRSSTPRRRRAAARPSRPTTRRSTPTVSTSSSSYAAATAPRRDAGARARAPARPGLRHRGLRGDGGEPRLPTVPAAGRRTGSTCRAAPSTVAWTADDRVLLTGPAVIVAEGVTDL